MKTLKTKTYPKSTPNNEGLVPVYIRIYVNGTDATFSTGINVSLDRWKKTDGFRNTRNKEEQDIRFEVDSAIKKLEEIADNLLEAGEAFNAKMVINIATGKTEKRETFKTNNKISFIKAFEMHHQTFLRDNIELRLEKGLSQEEAEKDAKLSHNKYNSMKQKVVDYLKKQYKLDDMPLASFDDEFQQGFLKFLKAGLGRNTAIKYFKSFNYIFKFSVKKKLLEAYPFTDDYGYLPMEKTNTAALTPTELNTIIKKKFKTERMNIVKDIFVFLSLTGYSYIDYKKLKRSNIETRNRQMFIIRDRKKSGNEQNVPLLPQAIAILDKYKNHPDCVATGSLLPIRSDVKLNEYLKDIASLCEINKHLTTKVARKTFASMLANAGAQIKAVSRLIGHSRISTTEQFYINTDDEVLINAVKSIQNKVKLKVA